MRLSRACHARLIKGHNDAGTIVKSIRVAASIGTSNIKAKLHLDDLVDLIIRAHSYEVLYIVLYKTYPKLLSSNSSVYFQYQIFPSHQRRQLFVQACQITYPLLSW